MVFNVIFKYWTNNWFHSLNYWMNRKLLNTKRILIIKVVYNIYLYLAEEDSTVNLSHCFVQISSIENHLLKQIIDFFQINKCKLDFESETSIHCFWNTFELHFNHFSNKLLFHSILKKYFIDYKNITQRDNEFVDKSSDCFDSIQ